MENRERLVVTCRLLGRCRFHPKRLVGNDQSFRVWPLLEVVQHIASVLFIQNMSYLTEFHYAGLLKVKET